MHGLQLTMEPRMSQLRGEDDRRSDLVQRIWTRQGDILTGNCAPTRHECQRQGSKQGMPQPVALFLRAALDFVVEAEDVAEESGVDEEQDRGADCGGDEDAGFVREQRLHGDGEEP